MRDGVKELAQRANTRNNEGTQLRNELMRTVDEVCSSRFEGRQLTPWQCHELKVELSAITDTLSRSSTHRFTRPPGADFNENR